MNPTLQVQSWKNIHLLKFRLSEDIPITTIKLLCAGVRFWLKRPDATDWYTNDVDNGNHESDI